MSFRVRGLCPAPFDPLFALPEAELTKRGARRVLIETKPYAPCRVSLEDAEPGETVWLLSYLHQPADTAYRQQGPIFVRRGRKAYDGDTLGPAMQARTLSLRGFDAAGQMIEADLAEGAAAAALIETFFANPDVAYIHAHYARRGCFAARIERA